MASFNRKPCIIALQLQLCTARPRTRGLPMRAGTVGAGVVSRNRVKEVWEKKRKKGKIVIIIN